MQEKYKFAQNTKIGNGKCKNSITLHKTQTFKVHSCEYQE